MKIKEVDSENSCFFSSLDERKFSLPKSPKLSVVTHFWVSPQKNEKNK